MTYMIILHNCGETSSYWFDNHDWTTNEQEKKKQNFEAYCKTNIVSIIWILFIDLREPTGIEKHPPALYH